MFLLGCADLIAEGHASGWLSVVTIVTFPGLRRDIFWMTITMNINISKLRPPPSPPPLPKQQAV